MAPKHAPAAADKDRRLILPVLASSPADIGRLIHELEQIDEALLQLRLRAGGSEVKMFRTSRLMDQIVQLNGLNLLQEADRIVLQSFLAVIKVKAPVMHMSFSFDPSPAFTEKLMAWLRQEIHPNLLLSTGLQPTIGAGCVVRTNNRYFDFSLRQEFTRKRGLLVAALAASETAA